MVVVRDFAGTVYLARTSGRSQTDGKVFRRSAVSL